MECFDILKFSDGQLREEHDCAASEVPLTLVLDGKELATLLCSPDDLKELVYGFLFTSGLINATADVRTLTVDETKWTAFADLAAPSALEDTVFKRLYTSGCGRGAMYYSVTALTGRAKVVSELSLSPDELLTLAGELQKRAACYLETGCTHSAALAGRGGIEIFREDIGRHNAVDKVIGARLLAGGGFRDSVLLSSGRVSSEVLLKARRCGVPVIVSRGAPTAQSIKLAREMDLTLAGFARGRRFNVYSGAGRIKQEAAAGADLDRAELKP